MARSFFERLTGSIRVGGEEKSDVYTDESVKKPLKTKEAKRKRSFADTIREPLAEEEESASASYSAPEADQDRSPTAHLEEATQEFADETEGELMLDIYDEGSHFVVQSTVAGVQPDSIDISLDANTLTIRGERSDSRESRDKSYYLKELYWGRFSRSVVLPEEVEGDKVEASMKNGLLTVRIPKKYKGEKKIKVRLE